MVFVVAAMVRTVAAAGLFSGLESDPDGYRQLALTWRETGVLAYGSGNAEDAPPRPTAFRPPLYPLVLAALVQEGAVAPEAIAALHVALGAGTAVLTFLLARQAGLGAGAYLAAALTACDPILLNQAAQVMTETLATFLAVVGLLALTWYGGRPSTARAAACGAVVGLATLCRPTFFFWMIFVIAAIAAAPRRSAFRWKHAAAMLLAGAMVLAPWTLRNWVQLGRPVFATTHGGYTLWLGNNDLYYDHLHQREGPFDATRLRLLAKAILGDGQGNEVRDDRLLNQAALETIRRRPWDFAYACAVRIGSLWRCTPQQTAGSESTFDTLARLAVGVWYAGVFLLAAVGLLSLKGRLAEGPWLWGILLSLAFTFVHTFYWTDMRMRAPLAPAVALAAAAGATRLLRSRKPDAATT
jgi:4-amino-4-deoxy-L-arabinose transferase-like glycosyltransferase